MDRFKDLEWFSELSSVPPIIIGGAGGIGSFLTLWLSRMELDIILYDFDQIERTNMAGQHYNHSDIGKAKTLAIGQQVKSFSGIEIETRGEYKEDGLVSTIMFSGFDNMDARKIMFQNWKKQENREIFIDGRMLAETFQVFAVTPENEDIYEQDYLFDSSEAAQVMCTAKATTHCGAAIASYMTSIFTNYLTNRKHDANISTVPFKTVVNLDTLTHYIDEKAEPVKKEVDELTDK